MRISPKNTNQVFFADAYDRTPPALDVFQCDECNKYILKERHHCTTCQDFDLCQDCAATSKHVHRDDFEIIREDVEAAEEAEASSDEQVATSKKTST